MADLTEFLGESAELVSRFEKQISEGNLLTQEGYEKCCGVIGALAIVGFLHKQVAGVQLVVADLMGRLIKLSAHSLIQEQKSNEALERIFQKSHTVAES